MTPPSRAQQVAVSCGDAEGHLGRARQFLEDADSPGLSSEARFALLYDAARNAVMAALAAGGVRVTVGDGAHRVTIKEGERLLYGQAGRLDALDQARRIRNGIEYSFQPVGRQDVNALATLAADLIEQAGAFVDGACPGEG